MALRLRTNVARTDRHEMRPRTSLIVFTLSPAARRPRRAARSLELVVAVEVVVAAEVAAAGRAAALLVDVGDDGRADVLDLLELLVEVLLLGLLVVVEPLVGLLERLLDRLLVVVADLVGDALLGVVELVLHRVDVVLELVARLDLLADLLVLRQAALVVGDRDLLVLARALVLGADVEDAVGVNLERDLDLGHAARRRRDAAELELAEEVAVLGHGALALEDLDHDGRLVVLVGREDLRLLGGDDGVARDELGHHAANGLNAEGEGGHVEQQQVLGLVAALAREDAALDGRAVGDGLVGVDALVRLLAVEEVLEEHLDLGDAGGAANEHDLVNLGLLHLGVVHDLLDGGEGLLEEVDAQLLEARAGERLREVDAVEEALDLEADLVLRRERALGALDLAAELLDGTLVLRRVGAVLALEDLEQVLDHAVVEAVRDRGRGRLVDDAHHVQARDGAGVLGRLALGVVEVGRDSHHGVLDLLAKEGLGGLLHLDEDHGGDLLGGEGLGLARGLNLDVRLAVVGHHLERPELHVVLHSGVRKTTADEALGVVDGVGGVERGLVLGGVADQALRLREGHVRRGHTVTLIVRDDLDLAVLVDTDARVGGAQVNADDVTDLAALLLVSTGAAQQGQPSDDRTLHDWFGSF